MNMNPQTPEPQQAPGTPASHVTSQPVNVNGENYDPRLRVQMANEPDIIHAARPIEPKELEVSDELIRRHEEAKQLYPELNLSKGEYVLLKIQRHVIGLLAPVGVTAFLLSLFVGVWIMYPVILEANDTIPLPDTALASLVIVCLMVLVAIFGYIAVWIYQRNTFFLTNESVIQEIQHSLFSKHEQTVSLGSIEDVSFRQTGLLQTMFNYGSIRLSTEGEETTYRFYFVSEPKRQVAILNNAVESFKNGRPVTGS